MKVLNFHRVKTKEILKNHKVLVKIRTNTTIVGQKHGQMDDLITTTTIFSPKTNKKTFTKVNLNNANFGEFMRIFLQKCEANAKRTTKLFMRSEANKYIFDN